LLQTASPEVAPSLVAGFRQDLADAGYIDGRDVRIEFRSTDNQMRLPELAADLVRSQAALIVAADGPAVGAAKAATLTIPIIFVTNLDPVKFGLVTSLNRPDGNLTGVTYVTSEILGKQLDLLRQIGPRAATVGYLSQSGVRTSEELTSDVLAASRALGTELVVAQARSRSDIETAFANLVERRAGALIVAPHVLFNINGNRILELAARNKIPTMHFSPRWVRLGGLMSYGASIAGVRKIVVDYVGRILKGAKPADLPIQRPTAFDLVINLKTANALGLTVPNTLLALADEVIE
jgi:putative ABC transport system substrate-binding protein